MSIPLPQRVVPFPPPQVELGDLKDWCAWRYVMYQKRENKFNLGLDDAKNTLPTKKSFE